MSLHRWLILRLEAPLIAFGGVAVDQIGVTRDFPAASMLTGLLANALGWERTARQAHQRLQERLIFAARRDRESRTGVLTDSQNARLYERECGWTTSGACETRDSSFKGVDNEFHRLGKFLINRRSRDYHTDACVTVALCLSGAEEKPDLDDLAAALDRPARPLFLGRKPCLPASRILQGAVEAETAYAAIVSASAVEGDQGVRRALWPWGEGPSSGEGVERIYDLPDLRNWKTGLHGGVRRVVEGRIRLSGGTA